MKLFYIFIFLSATNLIYSKNIKEVIEIIHIKERSKFEIYYYKKHTYYNENKSVDKILCYNKKLELKNKTLYNYKNNKLISIKTINYYNIPIYDYVFYYYFNNDKLIIQDAFISSIFFIFFKSIEKYDNNKNLIQKTEYGPLYINKIYYIYDENNNLIFENYYDGFNNLREISLFEYKNNKKIVNYKIDVDKNKYKISEKQIDEYLENKLIKTKYYNDYNKINKNIIYCYENDLLIEEKEYHNELIAYSIIYKYNSENIINYKKIDNLNDKYYTECFYDYNENKDLIEEKIKVVHKNKEDSKYDKIEKYISYDYVYF